MDISNQEHSTATTAACAATPLGRAIRLLGDEWVLLIVMNLLQGPMRFNTLRASLGHISSKTLSLRLKGLEGLGFVQREAFLEIPPRVEYQLTKQGQELVDVIAAIEQFGEKHLSNPITSECDTCPSASDEANQHTQTKL